MNILITGGSGFIGLPIVRELIKKDNSNNILALTRKNPETLVNADTLEWIQTDLNNVHSFQKKIKDFEPEVIIHLAWEKIPDFSLEPCLSNLNQSIDFFQFIFSLKSCKKIITSGSCFEYATIFGECIESQNTEPTDLFTWAKLSLLNYLKIETQKREISLAWFRIFYAYGPGQREQSLIPILLNNLNKDCLPQLKTPNNCNDYIFVQDIADLFSIAVTKEFPSGIYNIGSGERTSVLEICEISESIVLNQRSLTKQLKEDTINIPSESSFQASMELTEKIFGWKALTKLKDGIEITYKKLNDY
jgi:UDP-glucose 4-epimerase